ncbi:MAG TPA: hypothetical protein VJ904_04275 [Tichowtungia sp.]|nr:hypothetical protein [Tichowtungia sp.]
MFFLLITGFEAGSILYLNGGVFTYSLDDAYIHLSLAEQIHHGHYGINAGEYSSPSSSVLCPFLLAPFSGLPSFRNDVYVLDIWGLASKAALENRLKKRSNHWMNALAAQHHVDLAVVYETDSLPDNWIPLAEWTLSRRRITPAFDTVTVFSLNPDQIPVQKKRLSRFSETLPPGVSWRWRE